LDATGPPSPNDHPAWSPPPGPGPWSATTPATGPRRPAGAGEHLLLLGSRHRPAPWPWTSARVGPLGPRRRRGRDAGQAAALATVNPRASQPRPTPHHRFPSGPMQAGDHPPAAMGTSTRCARPGRPAPPSNSRIQRGADRGGGSAPDTGACPSGHPDAPDAWTPDAWTPDVWTLDVRLTGWTDVPTADRTRRTGQRPAGLTRASGSPAVLAGQPRGPGHGGSHRRSTRTSCACAACPGCSGRGSARSSVR
jgi:hypothetical protein